MKYLFKIVVAFAMCAVSITAFALPENSVCFQQMITRYNATDVVVTPHERYDPEVYRTGNNHCLTLKADRKKSEATLNWVESQLTSSGITWNRANMVDTIGADHKPEKLNLAIRVNVTLDSTIFCDNIILGQTSTSLRPYNFWWLFSNMSSESYKHGTDVTYIMCKYGKDQVPTTFVVEPRDDDRFTFDVKQLSSI